MLVSGGDNILQVYVIERTVLGIKAALRATRHNTKRTPRPHTLDGPPNQCRRWERARRAILDRKFDRLAKCIYYSRHRRLQPADVGWMRPLREL